MNYKILQKLVIYVLALSGGVLISFAIESGDVKEYLYGITPLAVGLFYVFMEVRK